VNEAHDAPSWAPLLDLQPSFTPPAKLVLETERIPAPPSLAEQSETMSRVSPFDTGPNDHAGDDSNPWLQLEDAAACKVELRTEQDEISVDTYWIRRTTAGIEYVGWVDSKGELSGQVRQGRDALGRVIEKEIHRREPPSECAWEREREVYRYDGHGDPNVALGEYIDRDHPLDRFRFHDQFVTIRDDSGRPLRTYSFQGEALWNVTEYTWNDTQLAVVTNYNRNGAWEYQQRFTWHGDFVRIDLFMITTKDVWRHDGWGVYERLGPNDYRALAASSDAQLNRPQQTWTYETTEHSEVVTERRGDFVVWRKTYEIGDGIRRLSSHEGRLPDGEALVVLEQWDWSAEPATRRTRWVVEAHYHECPGNGVAELERAARKCPPPNFGAPAVELRE